MPSWQASHPKREPIAQKGLPPIHIPCPIVSTISFFNTKYALTGKISLPILQPIKSHTLSISIIFNCPNKVVVPQDIKELQPVAPSDRYAPTKDGKIAPELSGEISEIHKYHLISEYL